MSTRYLHDNNPKTAALGKENADSNIIKKRRIDHKEDKRERIGVGIEESISSKSCETPKSEANKIPEIVTCPPAPRKPMRKAAVLSCKRKLMAEFEFFEADRRQEVDEFFRSSFEKNSNSAARAKARNDVGSASAAATESCSSSSPLPLMPCN